MRKKFKFKKGARWDGDEEIIRWIEDKLTTEKYTNWQRGSCPIIKKGYVVVVEVRDAK